MTTESTAGNLSGAARKELRRLAHPLRPAVQIGEAGLSESVLRAIEGALERHELIKLQIVRERDGRRELASEVASRTGSELAGLIGRMAILYRPARDPERRRIQLASARSADT
jgi:RNA-binding protein